MSLWKFWRIRLAFLAILCIPLLIVVGWNWYAREAVAWDYAGLPDRIHYCDRDYQPGPHKTASEIADEPSSISQRPLRQVGKSASGRPIFARPLSDAERRAYGTPLLPCDLTVYLQVGSDDFMAYALMGGP